MNIKTFIISLFIILGFAQIEKVCAQEKFPNGIRKSFVLGDSKKLATYFDRNVELLLFNKGDVYSKAQAELIMKNFFIKHTPESFIVESEDKDEASSFAIALLATKLSKFRVFIAYQNSYDKHFINQMIISEVHNTDN